ncbi:predicted protein [Pyrenophora tritici-repentis Pt-1C-BFP]|uniref:Uncharacterized protein n=1 Tax=Pyrenophora tritici-repentis (strain Pt-1C-BFP) TaxID=426418 RepID=B2WJF6_PYRTR|nr:uncharacterized protein PTRG_10115 [Pyrenophora tritici-repentis Pt-1C-BFP]EDU43166.1 predicted protein [Pyrenophora tritici-repentis Pt-1C-BFP]
MEGMDQPNPADIKEYLDMGWVHKELIPFLEEVFTDDEGMSTSNWERMILFARFNLDKIALTLKLEKYENEKKEFEKTLTQKNPNLNPNQYQDHQSQTRQNQNEDSHNNHQKNHGRPPREPEPPESEDCITESKDNAIESGTDAAVQDVE